MEEFLTASTSCRCQATDGKMVIFSLENSPDVDAHFGWLRWH